MLSVRFEYLYLFHHHPSVTVSSHAHRCYELCYYLDGKGTTTFHDETLQYDAHCYTLYEPNVIHDETHDEMVQVFCIGFMLVNDNGMNVRSGVFRDTGKEVLNYVNRIRSEYAAKNPSYRAMIQLLTAELLIVHDRQQNRQTPNQLFDKISEIRIFIDENFNQNLNVEALAESSGYSYHHFRHLFKDKVGDSPKNYLMRKRLECARNMLAYSDMCISEIAYSSGFSTSSQFSFIFKKSMHMSPTQYRQQYSQPTAWVDRL